MMHSEESKKKISESTRRHWAESPRPRASAEERILSRIEKVDGHWIWQGWLNNVGYPTLSFNDRNLYAHRLSYETFIGPIGAGLQIDHLCRTPACINPAHLEPVTPRLNVRRGTSPSAVAAVTGVCQRGHEFTPENTYVRRDGKRRMCRECIRLRKRKAWSEGDR